MVIPGLVPHFNRILSVTIELDRFANSSLGKRAALTQVFEVVFATVCRYTVDFFHYWLIEFAVGCFEALVINLRSN